VGATVAFTATASDAEDAVGSLAWGWRSSLDGVIGSASSFTKTSLSQGTHLVTAVVTDTQGITGTDSIAITVNESGSLQSAWAITADRFTSYPPLLAEDTYLLDEDVPLYLSAPGVLDNRSRMSGDALAAILVGNVSSGTLLLNLDGSLVYTPTCDWAGTDTFSYTVYDGAGQSDVVTATLVVAPVPDPPVALDDLATTLPDTPVAISVLENDRDPDPEDVLSVVSAGLPVSGTVAISGTNTLVYTPTTFIGTDSVAYTVTDGMFVVTATVTIRVDPFAVTILGPVTGQVGPTQGFTATVGPTATLPMTYTWQATGQGPTLHTAVNGETDTITFTWGIDSLPVVTATQDVTFSQVISHVEIITLTVSNAQGTVTTTHTFTLCAEIDENGICTSYHGTQIYLPLVIRP
jgi:hypothetical protein